jgi:hypothetical protein
MHNSEEDLNSVLGDNTISSDETMVENVSVKKLTVSHVNKKLARLQAEMKEDTHSTMAWLVRNQEQEERREKERLQREEERVRKEEERLQREASERQERQQRKAIQEREKQLQDEANWRDLKDWQTGETARITQCEGEIEKVALDLKELGEKSARHRLETRAALSSAMEEVREFANVSRDHTRTLDRMKDEVGRNDERLHHVEQRLTHLDAKWEDVERKMEEVVLEERRGGRNLSPVVRQRRRNSSGDSIRSQFSIEPNIGRETAPFREPLRVNLVAPPVNNELSPSNIIPLPTFSGDIDLKIFRQQCLIISNNNRWTNQQLCSQILTHLKGKALDLLTYFPDVTNITLEQLWEALGSRFGKTVSSEAARQELHCFKQKKEQSFSSLGLDIEKLVRTAFPGANMETWQTLMLDHFLKAIAHPHIRYQTRLVAPRNMSAAIEEASRIFQIMQAEGNSRLAIMAGIQPSPVSYSNPPNNPVSNDDCNDRRVSGNANFPMKPPARANKRNVSYPASQDVRWNGREDRYVRFDVPEHGMESPHERRRRYEGYGNRGGNGNGCANQNHWRDDSNFSQARRDNYNPGPRGRSNYPPNQRGEANFPQDSWDRQYLDSGRSRSLSRDCLKGRELARH